MSPPVTVSPSLTSTPARSSCRARNSTNLSTTGGLGSPFWHTGARAASLVSRPAPPRPGVDQARDVPPLPYAVDAGVAGDGAADLVRPPLAHLARPLGVGDQLSSERDHVGVALAPGHRGGPRGGAPPHPDDG